MIQLIDESPVKYGGTTLPRSFNALLTHPGWSTRASLSVTIDSERGPVATGLAAVVDADTTDLASYIEVHDLLRRLSIDTRQLLRELAADALASKVASYLLSEESPRRPKDQRRKTLTQVRDHAYERSAPQRRHLLTLSHLQEVANEYRRALAAGQSPTQTVAHTFHVSHSTAAKWVAKARTQGALGAARGTRPGELEQP